MSDSTAERYPGADAAERLLDGAARGDDQASDPLAALLVAAATPDRDRALADEAAAVAMFRAAQRPAPNLGHRRTVRAAAAAALAAVTLGGVAVAADPAGLPLPPFHDRA
jgi:hypothetical protein